MLDSSSVSPCMGIACRARYCKHSIILSRQNRLVSIVFLAAPLDIWMIFPQLLECLFEPPWPTCDTQKLDVPWIVPKPSSSWKIRAKWKPILYFWQRADSIFHSVGRKWNTPQSHFAHYNEARESQWTILLEMSDSVCQMFSWEK